MTRAKEKPGNIQLGKDKRDEVIPLLVYFIQALGECTEDELRTAIKEQVHVLINKNTIKQYCTALYKRNIIRTGNRIEDNLNVPTWAMEKLSNMHKFREAAQYKDVVAAVLTSEVGEALMDLIDSLEGTGGRKGQTGPRDYHYVRFYATLIEPWFGSWPISPYLARSLADSPYKCDRAEVLDGLAAEHRREASMASSKKEADALKRKASHLSERAEKIKQNPKAKTTKTDDEAIEVMRYGMVYFLRCAINGDIMIHRQSVRGFFRQILALLNMGEYFQKRLYLPPIRIQPQLGLVINQKPIIAPDKTSVAGTGRGIASMETLKPRETFHFTVGFPKTNGINPQQLRKAFLEMGLLSARTLSPAVGTALGGILLTHFEEIGDSLDMKAIEECVPTELLTEENVAFIEETLAVRMPNAEEEKAAKKTTADAFGDVAKDIQAVVVDSNERHQKREWTASKRREWLKNWMSAQEMPVSPSQIRDAFKLKTGLDISLSTVDRDLNTIGALKVAKGQYVYTLDESAPPEEPAETAEAPDEGQEASP